MKQLFSVKGILAVLVLGLMLPAMADIESSGSSDSPTDSQADSQTSDSGALEARQQWASAQESLITEFQQRRKSLSKSSVSAFKFPEMTVCKAL